MTNLLIGLGMLFTIGMTAPIVEPNVMYANEVETPVETPFEQVVYTNEEAHLKITLTSETECSIEMTNDGETRVKDNVPYSIVENELTIVLNEQNFTFVIGENNTLTPKEIEPIEPQEHEWIVQEYKMLVSETDTDINEYILILTSETEFRFINKYTNKASEQTVSTEASGTYTKRWKKIELYCDQELPFYEIEIDQDNGTFKEYESIVDKIPTVLDEAWSKVAYWLNQPFIIAGECSLSLGAIIWMIIRMTSFGKKNIRSLNDRMTRKEKDYESREKDYQKTIAKQNELIETYGNYILILAENSRNEEIKKIAYEIKKNKGEVENGKEAKAETESSSN